MGQVKNTLLYHAKLVCPPTAFYLFFSKVAVSHATKPWEGATVSPSGHDNVIAICNNNFLLRSVLILKGGHCAVDNRSIV